MRSVFKVRVGPPPVKIFAFVDFYILSMASARSSAGINGESTEGICIDNIIIVLVPLLKSERSVAYIQHGLACALDLTLSSVGAHMHTGFCILA